MSEIDHIQQLTSNLQQILETGVFDQNDFISLAIAGEQLRRAAIMLDDLPAETSKAMGAYDRLLSTDTEEVPSGLEPDLEQAIAAIQQFAASTRAVRDADEGLYLLENLDEVLCVAAAAHRAGALPQQQLEAMAARSCEAMAELAPDLSDLWEFAEETDQLYGPDPDMPELFSWWEAVASYSMSRASLEISASLASPARKQEIIDEVLDRMERGKTAEVRSLFPAPDTPDMVREQRTEYRLAAAPDIQEGEVRRLQEVEPGIELHIGRAPSGFYLMLVATEPARIGSEPTLRLSAGTVAVARKSGAKTWSVDLPSGLSGDAVLVIAIDGASREVEVSLAPT